jgi:CubicO group peptidase (beta-lactamase class C family)
VETQLKRSTPEAEGIPSQAILDFVRAIEQEHEHPLDAVQGFMLLRHGSVVAEGWRTPYRPTAPHMLYSLSKSFTSTAIGLAVAEGLLTVDDPVLGFFPDDAPENPGENLKAMQVRHLLSMNTGHHEDSTGQVCRVDNDNWPRAFLSLPVEHEPGSWFVYNTAATYMLSAIITRLTGQPLLDYLRPRLFDPLGIENPTWDTDPKGISQGGTGLHATTEDIARFGQLYLRNGNWQGQQLVPAAWVAEATDVHSDNSNTQTNPDWIVGYGYQFWRARHDAYRGDGAFGQYCIVMPEQDAVLAINSGLMDMQAVLDIVWEILLPAMKPDTLPANDTAQADLGDAIAALTMPLPQGHATSITAEQVSGVTHDLDANDLGIERVTATFEDDRATVSYRIEGTEQQLAVGYGTWLDGVATMPGDGGRPGPALGNEPVAAAGAWTADDTFEVRTCFYEGVFCPIFRFHFTGDTISVEFAPNVSWAGAEAITILGRRTGSAA